MLPWVQSTTLPPAVEGKKSKEVLVEAAYGLDFGMYDHAEKKWITVNGIAENGETVHKWCPLSAIKTPGWISFKTSMPPVSRQLLVWDVRVAEAILVNIDHLGWMTEPCGRRYHVSNQMFYSHYFVIQDPDSDMNNEIAQWVEEHGVRLGIDK